MEISDQRKAVRVLLIEDNAADAFLIEEHLKEITDVSYEVTCVQQLQEGLDLLARQAADIVLSDLSLPDSPGLETFKRLQAQVTQVPVIVLTGFDNKSVALQAVHDGAQDYLIKGQVEGKTLSRLIQYAIERHRSQAALRNQSVTDALTGLYNRRGFTTLGEQALKAAHRSKTPLCLFFADLDGLKKINDTFGHPEGDQAIADAADILRQTFRESDIVARIGGDEFAILATPEPATNPDRITLRLKENLKQHNSEKKKGYDLSLSIGLAQLDPMTLTSMDELMAKADNVLYAQKKQRKSTPIKKSHRRQALWGLCISALLGMGYAWRYAQRPPPHQPTPIIPIPVPISLPKPIPMVVIPKPTLPASVPRHPAALTRPLPASKPVPVTAAPPVATHASTALNSPDAIHDELIPKSVSILRFYYAQQIAWPGMSFGFDVNGSGFTSEFLKDLSVSAGSPAFQATSLHAITANQIHGEMHIAADASTQYVFPRVMLHQRAIFKAPQPFAVIRPDEVLDIVFTGLDEDGRGGRFRVYTNLSSKSVKLFRLKANNSDLQISALKPNPPFAVDGSLHLNKGVEDGDYDLIAFLGSKEIFRKKHMLHIVRPNLGRTGLIQTLAAATRYHRPGDNVELFLQGTGFSAEDIDPLIARVDEIDMGKSAISYISPTRLGIYFTVPHDAAEGTYGVLVEQNHRLVFRQKAVFSVVSANWIGGIQMTPLEPGESGTLKIIGRDISPAFAAELHLSTEEQGIHLSVLQRIDSNTLSAEVSIDTSVEPGDYVVTLTGKGGTLNAPLGSLIRVTAP